MCFTDHGFFMALTASIVARSGSGQKMLRDDSEGVEQERDTIEGSEEVEEEEASVEFEAESSCGEEEGDEEEEGSIDEDEGFKALL
jgi:hypothetical protein